MNAKWICPAITPFCEDGTIDYESAGRFYDHLIANEIDGVLIGGSLGEFFGQTLEQREALARFAVRHIAGRMKVIIGTANMIAEEIAPLSNACLDAGADAVMIVPPFYFSFGDGEMYSFYSRMAEEIHGPVYIYNFPDRTGYTIRPSVVRRLAEAYDNIIGIKDTIHGSRPLNRYGLISRSIPASTITLPTMSFPAETVPSAVSPTWRRNSVPTG